MDIPNHFTTRIEVSNHIDGTSYIIAYTYNEKITMDMIKCRIKNDIIKMTRMIRVDRETNMANAQMEFNEKEKTACVYTTCKLNELWHTGATIAIFIKPMCSLDNDLESENEKLNNCNNKSNELNKNDDNEKEFNGDDNKEKAKKQNN